MIRSLYVVCEVPIHSTTMRLSNSSMHPILESYADFFDVVHYIGPSDSEFTRLRGEHPRIYYSSVIYGKPLKKRLVYFMKKYQHIKRFKELFSLESDAIIQLRFPALFPLLAYSAIKELGSPFTTYIAGNWVESFSANYSFPGHSLFIHLLNKYQTNIVNRSVPVATGPELAAAYNNCYAYFSTTHNEVILREPRTQPRRILFVGRLEPLKRVEDVILALLKLQSNSSDWMLSIVGEGKQRSRLEKLVADNGLCSKVEFKGYISDPQELRTVFLSHDILVLPSITEGTAKVLPEAMSYGVVPIAVRDVGSNNYIIQDGSNGFLVDRQSPIDIADKCKRLAESDVTYKMMVQNGYSYARDHTIDKEVGKMWSYVKEKLS